MPTIPRQPPPARRSRAAGIRRPSPTPRPKGKVEDETTPMGTEPEPPEAAAPEAAALETELPEAGASEAAAPERERPEEPSRKPSPRPKRRDGGVAKPVGYEPAVTAVIAPADPWRAPARTRHRIWPATVLLGVAAVFIGLAVWFKLEDNQFGAPAANTALLDVARTAQVNQAATSAVETLFSYDYNNIAKTQDAAKDLLLNNEVRDTYNRLMGDVERLAPQQKMVLTVKTSRSAVISIEGDRARVMVFVDQTATRTDQNKSNGGSAMLWVNMQFSDGKWKITGLDTYKAPQPAATPPAKPGN
ncbi:hypothetical protein [Amycolatopsis taiwanensis]|uniref:hypothetical protein n=1 Tax=Amycolatopsis taiwanensis TaxID=342230 RepID=UPI00048538E4|nr:hypothetical protein [Amycolatopsis taiwanensis]